METYAVEGDSLYPSPARIALTVGELRAPMRLSLIFHRTGAETGWPYLHVVATHSLTCQENIPTAIQNDANLYQMQGNRRPREKVVNIKKL